MAKRRYCERYNPDTDDYVYCDYYEAPTNYYGECSYIACGLGLKSRFCEDGGKGFCTCSEDTLKKLKAYKDLEYNSAHSYDDIFEFEDYWECERKKEDHLDKWTAEDEAKLLDKKRIWDEARAKSVAFWDAKFEEFFKDNDKGGIIRKLMKRERRIEGS